MKKKLYINFYDRKGIFRLGIANGEQIPAGYIIGKGWKVKTGYESETIEEMECPKCGRAFGIELGANNPRCNWDQTPLEYTTA